MAFRGPLESEVGFMISNQAPARSRVATLRPYFFAVLGLVAATLVRMSLDPILGDRQAFMTYMAALIATAWLAGVGPSLFVLVCSVPLATYFFMEPRHNLAVLDGYNYIAVATYVALGFPIVALGGKFWRARQDAKRSEELYGTQARELASERKQLHQELETLSEQLREVDHRREDFLGILADELRRPLIPIASAASFHSIAATASEMESAMDIVKQETNQLGRLIDDLLDAFRHSQAGIQLNKRPMDLVEVANRAAASVRSTAAQSGRELNISLSKSPVLVTGDAARLERVVYNLLNNAVRSTNPGGQIWLTVQERDGVAQLKVKDTGVGLSAEALTRIAQAGASLDGTPPRERGGLSISMSAVRPIIELHNGMITAHSDGPGQGSEFVVRLPLMGGAPLNENRDKGAPSVMDEARDANPPTRRDA
jgi:signal transduction histidine kinase